METFSPLLAICAGNSPVSPEFTAQRPVMQGFDVFFDRIWINGWVNNHKAGDMRCYRGHYDITVMYINHILTTSKDIVMYLHYHV